MQIWIRLKTVDFCLRLTDKWIGCFETGNSGFLNFFLGSIPLKVQIDDAIARQIFTAIDYVYILQHFSRVLKGFTRVLGTFKV